MEQEQKLEYLDDLTGLHNRRYFREKLLDEKRKADERGSSFALMMIDLDNFKPVNDTYGHLTGDKILTEVGKVLKQSLGPTDILCRYAGDEFVAILPGTTEADVVQVAERINACLAKSSWTDDKGSPVKPVTCSLGYAFYAEAGKDPTTLISWADQALYAAKRRGGNGHCGERDIPAEPTGRPLVSTPYIIGREKEFSQLRSLLEQVRREGGGLAFIDGEIGVGKTRLMKEIRQFFERRGGTALSGGCHVETASIPYYPFREAFRRFFDERREEGRVSLDILPDYSQKELARILPGLTEVHVSELDRAPDSYRLFEAVRLLLQRISARASGPLLLIVEDIHWSDRASLDLLHYLARNLKEAPVLLCATCRVEEEHRGSSLPRFLASIRAEKLAEEIRLHPLSPESVSAMLYLLCPGVRFSQELQEALYRKTEGNPFFVEELLKAYDPDQMTEGLSRVEPVPVSLKAILGNRIDSLSPETRDVLACGALVGEEFEFEVVCKALDRPLCEIMDALEEGLRNHIISEVLPGDGDTYRFTHSLMADVLSSGVSKVRSRMWHQQVGNALEKMYSERLEQVSGRLMYHFERGENCEKALSYALKAADRARDDYANEEAIRYYKKAQVMTHRLEREASDERASVSEHLGDVYTLTSHFAEAVKHYEEALRTLREKDSSTDLARALLKAGKALEDLGDYAKARAYYSESHSLQSESGNEMGRAKALIRIGKIYCHDGNYDMGLTHLEDAKTIFAASQNRQGLADVLHVMGTARFDRGSLADALDCCTQALEINQSLGNRSAMALNLNAIGTAYWNHGEFEKAIEYYREAHSISKEIGNRSGAALFLHNIGIIHANWGEYEEALDCYRRALQVQRELGIKKSIALSLHSIGIIHWCRGDYADAMKSHIESIETKRAIGDRYSTALSHVSIGCIETDRGEYGKALENLKLAMDAQREMGDNWGRAFALAELGRLHQGLLDVERALSYHQDSLALMEEMALKAEKSELLSAIGLDYHLLGDDEEAIARLNEALEIAVELRAREAEPTALEALSQVYQSTGDLQKAREYCERLLSIAEERGLKKYLAAAKRTKGEILMKQALGSQPSAVSWEEPERELREAVEIAEKIGALPLLWQVHASLGRLYGQKGDQATASREFAEAGRTIDEISSKIDDEELRERFRGSRQVQAVLERKG